MLGIFWGCTTRSNEKLLNNLKGVLEKAGAEYTPVAVELCCAAPLILAGFHHAAVEQA